MEYIRLVPSDIKDSILKSNRKNCINGVIALELRITDYYMVISNTQVVSVDLSLLSSDAKYSYIEFNLTVFSTGNNVLNLSGFNIDQIQVLNGESHFTIRRNIGDAKWVIQMKSSETRPEMWLRCYKTPFVPQFNTGVYNFFNLKYYNSGGIREGIFYNYAPGQTGRDAAYGPFQKIGDGGYICAKFPMPIWLQSVYIAVSNNNYTINDFPISLQLYGSNDGVGWTQILNTSLTPSNGSIDNYLCITTNYYTLFKFKFMFNNSADVWYFPSIALSGFCSELINTGAYSMATPYCTVLPTNGYNIEVNSSDMSSTAGDLVRISQFEGDYYQMNRSNTNTPWEFIYTFPEAIRTIGLIYKVRYNYSFKLFSLSYSDDKTNWTEYCKVDGSLEAWNQGFNENQIGTYFCDSCSEHRYYKIIVYSNNGSTNEQYLQGLGFLQFQKGHYFSFESFIPKLSSNMQSGYIIVSSNSSEGDAYKLFDYSESSYGGGDISNGEWSLTIMLPQATVVRGLELEAPPSNENRMPYEFSIQGSNDNSAWTILKSFSLGSNYWTRAFQLGQWEIENETAYQYYKLVVTATAQGSVVRIGEMGLSSYASFKGVDWYEYEYLVPIMTANEQDGYVASASSYFGGHYPYYAFDRNNSSDNKWLTSSGDVSGSWLKIELPTSQQINAFSIQTPDEGSELGRLPTSFKIQGSDDDSDWTDLVDVSDISWSNNEIKNWNNTSTTAYKYYRILISANGGSNMVAIGNWNLVNITEHERN